MKTIRLLFLLATAILGFAPRVSAQGFGYATAHPDIPRVRVNVKGLLYGSPTSPDISFKAYTSRDSAGVASGSRALFEIEEVWFRYANFVTRADLTGICTDYNASTNACANGWQNVAASVQSLDIFYPTLPSGADVTPRTLGIRFNAYTYNSIGQYLATESGVATRMYQLVPPPDYFLRDADDNEIAIWKQRAQPGATGLSRPLLIAEGIDISDRSEPDEYFGQLGALANVLRNGGYDVAVVSFGQPLRSVRFHEGGFRRAVQLMHQMKTDATKPTAVMGLSRGGLVARYALAKMEELSTSHHVSVFISYDSPQRGANINSELQSLIFNESTSDAASQMLINQIKSEGVRELLQDHVCNRWPGSACDQQPGQDLHATLLAETRALNGGLGYPAQVRRVAWSNGTWETPTFTGDLLVEVDAEASGRDKYARLTSFDRQPGSFLPSSFRSLVDGRDGDKTDGDILLYTLSTIGGLVFTPLTLFTQNFGGYYRIKVHNDATFIPTASALDRDAEMSTTPFHRAEHGTSRRSHAAVPPEAVTMILQELGLVTVPPVVPLAVTINGPYHVPTNPGSWTASVNRAAPHGFTFAWRYRLDLTGACDLDGPLERSASTTTTAKKPGGGETNLITQCIWTTGPTSPTFSYSISADAWLDVEVTATNGTQSVTQLRRVRYGSLSGGGGDGPMAASPSTEGSLTDASIQADALTVDVFEVAGVRPSVVRSGDRVRVDYALPNASDVEIRVRDVLGRVHHQATEARPAGRHRSDLAVSSLPAGLYLVTVRAGEAQRTVRFVVQ